MTSGDTEMGEILSVYGSKALRLMRLDRLDDSKSAIRRRITCPVAHYKPKWLD